MGVLSSVKDKNGNPAILTANNIVANPDFDKIKESGYQQYFYKPFTQTLEEYPNHDRVMDLYNEGIGSKIIKPQFHGREHLNVTRWLRDINNNTTYLLDAFEQKMFSLHWKENNPYGNEYMDGYDCDSRADVDNLEGLINDGIRIFNGIWGFESKSFIANCYIWPNEAEPVLKENNVQYIQGLPLQFVPVLEQGNKYKKKFHYTGQKNKLGQMYLVRNAFFEPSVYPKIDWVDECLKRIELAFKYKTPAIISTHRLNFISSIHEENSRNLTSLQELLKKIVQKWPDAEFVSSDELGDILKHK